jgi:hypothetical protein
MLRPDISSELFCGTRGGLGGLADSFRTVIFLRSPSEAV